MPIPMVIDLFISEYFQYVSKTIVNHVLLEKNLLKCSYEWKKSFYKKWNNSIIINIYCIIICDFHTVIMIISYCSLVYKLDKWSLY